MVRDAFPGSGLPDSFFSDEIAFIADQVDDSENAYLVADRTGRGIALDQTQRKKMHAVYQRYRGSLAANLQTDWHFIVRIVWDKIRARQLNLPRYRSIFVDEAQFFAPVWFAILKACLEPETGEFIVAADPTQGFLKRRLSWRSVGLNVTGRSTRLERSYRNSPAIQAFARRFYQTRLQEGTNPAEETTLPSDNQTETSIGTPPKFVLHRAAQDAIAWAAAETAEAFNTGLPPSAFLILAELPSTLNALQQALADRLGPDSAIVLAHNTAPGNRVALSTFNATTGIERPIVLLIGLDAILEQENDPRLDPRERTERIRDNTRKIYMTLTRAGEKLLISHRSEKTRKILEGVLEE